MTTERAPTQPDPSREGKSGKNEAQGWVLHREGALHPQTGRVKTKTTSSDCRAQPGSKRAETLQRVLSVTEAQEPTQVSARNHRHAGGSLTSLPAAHSAPRFCWLLPNTEARGPLSCLQHSISPADFDV